MTGLMIRVELDSGRLDNIDIAAASDTELRRFVESRRKDDAGWQWVVALARHIRESKNWQPIGTAPRDGTNILCWHRLWDVPKYAYLESFPEPCWKLTETMYQCGVDPSHWLPLEVPPE